MVNVHRHRRARDDQKTKKSSGLLSNVFSFVSREFESFVLNATASQPALVKRPARGSERNASEDEARYMSRTQHRRERERRSKFEPSRRKPRSDPTNCHNHSKTTYVDDGDRVLSASDRDCSNSPSPRPPSVFPVPQLPQLKKKPSITMPGSLFPRSPSLVPDTDHYKQPSLLEASPSRSHLPSADSGGPSQPCLDDYVSPWRTRRIASVKNAVTRFNATDGAEADFSLMLPSPHSSPIKTASNPRSIEEPTTPLPTASRKGKERARGRDDDDLDFIVVGASGHDDVHAKERELDVARQEQREHERRLNGDQSRRASDERERDKQRIQALEEEVRWLKEELSRSQMRTSPPPSLVLPPPPPPPPPLPPLPLRIDTVPCTPNSMFATARASLRHAMTPVEAPINDPVHRTKRQGQPTVNVPSEKMAAFLHEIMTAKLRKVGSGPNPMGGDGVAGPSGLSKSVRVTSTSSTDFTAQELKRRRSLASLRVPIGSSLAAPMSLSASATVQETEARVGEKRKADALGMNELVGAPSKRRMTQSSAPSSGTNQRNSSSSELSPRSSFSLPPLVHPTNETDVTTPSLCSDNDREENSIEDQPPSTPPGPRTAAATQQGSIVDTRQEEVEVIDVEMEEQRPTPAPNSARRTSQLFKRRPPMSPIPIPTPRRPSAPARTKRGATPKPKSALPMESDVNESEGDLSQPAPVPFLSLIPVPKSKPTKPKGKPTMGKNRQRAALPQQTSRPSISSTSGSSSQSKRKKSHKRRQTLDEELRVAEVCSSDIDECNDELDREGDVFVASGTMSKRRGFLAHGGGGGTPVFLGAGYVEGMARDSEDEDEVLSARPRRASKPSQASFIPRPKARS